MSPATVSSLPAWMVPHVVKIDWHDRGQEQWRIYVVLRPEARGVPEWRIDVDPGSGWIYVADDVPPDYRPWLIEHCCLVEDLTEAGESKPYREAMYQVIAQMNGQLNQDFVQYWHRLMMVYSRHVFQGRFHDHRLTTDQCYGIAEAYTHLNARLQFSFPRPPS